MAQRLPLILSLGAIGLLANGLPAHADVKPLRRPPAVPPLAAPAPDQKPVNPIALKREDDAGGFSDIAPKLLGRAIEFGHPPLASITLTQAESLAPAEDKLALKRDASANGKDIILNSLGLKIAFTVPAPVKIVVAEAQPEKTKPGDQITASAPHSEALANAAAQTPGDIARFLPDIELKDISQDAGLGYHASIEPFTVKEAEADIAPAEEKVVATLALPDIAPRFKGTATLSYSAPLSLLVMPAEEEVAAQLAGDAAPAPQLPPIKPRERPRNLIASNDDHASEARPLAPKGEPLFELRR